MAKILLVDDHSNFLFSLKDTLERCGFAAETATSGEEGLEKIKAEDFDAVLTDFSMPPGMNGAQMTREALKIKPFLKIIAMSDYAYMPEYDKGLSEAGCILVLEKQEIFNFLNSGGMQKILRPEKNPLEQTE